MNKDWIQIWKYQIQITIIQYKYSNSRTETKTYTIEMNRYWIQTIEDTTETIQYNWTEIELKYKNMP